MNNCYKTETLYFDKGLFDSCIDITYVITMVNSPRNEKIIKEINKYKPTKKVVILYNSGFKDCNKNMCNKDIDFTCTDLIHANKYIFNNSSQYNNILVLEDDAEFSDEILNSEHINNIEKFINNNNFNTYSLGSIKWISSPIGMHQRLFIKGGTHAMIYSKKFREEFKECKTTDLEVLTMFPYNMNGWTYYKTLIGQVIEETENSKNWILDMAVLAVPIGNYFTKDDCIQGIETINSIVWILQLLILLLVAYWIYKQFGKKLVEKLSLKNIPKLHKSFN